MRQLDGRISLKLGGKIHRELFDEQSDQDVTYFQSHQVKSTGNRKNGSTIDNDPVNQR